MKKLLLIAALAAAVVACKKKDDATPSNTTTTTTTQSNLASSDPQNKSVLIEDFTGVKCGYCPDGAIRSKAYSDLHPGKVVIIATHSGGYATPVSSPFVDYTTTWGESIRAQTGLTGYPAGTVNRHVFTGAANSGPYYPQATNKMALNRNGWSAAGDLIMGQASPVNIGVSTKWDATSRTLTVNTETYYTADETVENDLNVALTEDGVVGAQEDYTLPSPYINYSYTQNNMLRWYLTGQWGEKIDNTAKTSRNKKTYTYVVPANFNIDNCYVNVFVNEGHVETLNALKVKATK